MGSGKQAYGHLLKSTQLSHMLASKTKCIIMLTSKIKYNAVYTVYNNVYIYVNTIYKKIAFERQVKLTYEKRVVEI